MENDFIYEYFVVPIVQIFWTALIGSLFIPWFWGKIQSRRLMYTLLLEFRQNIVRFQRFKKEGLSLHVVTEDVWNKVKSDKNIMNWFSNYENKILLKRIELAFDHLKSKRAKVDRGQEKEDDWKTVQEKYKNAYNDLKSILIKNKEKIIWPICWIPRLKVKDFK